MEIGAGEDKDGTGGSNYAAEGCLDNTVRPNGRQKEGGQNKRE